MLGLDTLSKPPLESLWESGVAPLFCGSGFFLLGTSGLLRRFLPQTSLAHEGIGWLAIFFTAAAMAAVAIWGKRSVRDRIVSPRNGYMEPKSRKWLLLPMVLVPLILVPLVIAYAFTSYGRAPTPVFLDNARFIVPGFAVLFGALSLYYGRKRKMPLLLAYGIYLMCLAPLIWWLPLSSMERFDLLKSYAGGPLAVFGAARLRAFLKGNPKPVELTTGS